MEADYDEERVQVKRTGGKGRSHNPAGCWQGCILLQRYIERKKMTYQSFAKKIGLSKSALSKYFTGPKRPGAEMQMAIERASGGYIPMQSWHKKRNGHNS